MSLLRHTTLLGAAILSLLAGCERHLEPLERIRERGELRLVTRNGPTTYYLGRDGERGIEYELVSAFARELDVELVVTQAFTLRQLFAALERGEADIAAAGLTFTENRGRRFTASAAYATQRPLVVYKAGQPRPAGLADLGGMDLLVVAGSSHEDLVDGLRVDGQFEARVTPVATSDPFTLLKQVADGKADAALVDSRDFTLQQNLLPELKVAFDLGVERDIVWYLADEAAESPLLARVNDFLTRQRQEGRITELRETYFAKDERITRVDTQTFVKRMRRDLKDYQRLIEIVAREEELPWELLAAISYQESHWDANATSRTGVRGLMMLTQATAGDLGVRDRTDPTESMRGGARYFRQLRSRLPDDILEPDRTWLALAAYNIGRAHLEDARIVAERRGGDPHLWEDVMGALPLLENPQHYTTLRYGYARGTEAVRYVQNIRHYYRVLRLQSARDTAPEAPLYMNPLLPEALRRLSLLAL